MPTEQVKSTLSGFLDFIRTQGVVGLAVGVILGGAVGKMVSSLVQDVIMPVIGLVLGSTESVKDLSIYGIKYGNFIATFVDFIVIAAVVYFGIKMMGLDKLDKPKV